MPDGYELALFLHIVGVFGIAGAATSELLSLSWMRRVTTVAEARPLSLLAVWTDRAFAVAAVLVLAAGIYMVEDADWGWGTGWMNTSLIALIIMFAGGALLLTPRVGAIHKALDGAPDGPIPDDVREKIGDPLLWGTLHAFALALIAIIWNMTTKPGDAQAGIIILLAFVVGAASAIPMAMRQPEA
jgi:hypothetical protein